MPKGFRIDVGRGLGQIAEGNIDANTSRQNREKCAEGTKCINLNGLLRHAHFIEFGLELRPGQYTVCVSEARSIHSVCV